MKLLCAVAVAALAMSSVGCQAMKSSCKSCAGPCHVTQSQMAPRPDIMRSGCVQTGGICDSMGGGQACGCGDECGCVDCGDGGCGCQDTYGLANAFGNCGSGACGMGGACGTYGGGCGNGNCMVNNMVSTALDCAPTDNQYNFNPGPPTGQTAYPYYTTRGPRDFLARNPRSIGPTGAYGCR